MVYNQYGLPGQRDSMKHKMKLILPHSISKNVESGTISELKLTGEELTNFLGIHLEQVMKEIEDPDVGTGSPTKYIQNLQAGRLGNFEHRVILQALHEDDVQGLLVALPQDDNQYRILTIGVLKSLRSHGIGSKLIKTFINHPANEDNHHITLDVHDLNQKAIKLYKRLGFEITSIV